MSIARLREIASQTLPMNISDEYEIDELRVLIAAGLIAGLPLRVCSEEGSPAVFVVRVLAITPDGARLLQRCRANATLSAAPDH